MGASTRAGQQEDVRKDIMADFSNRALSIFDPHHIVTIEYPDVELCGGWDDGEYVFDSDKLALPGIENSAQRFEPQPLIQDKAVEAHSGLSSLAENPFLCVLPAPILTEAEVLDLLKDVKQCDHHNDLMQNMAIVTKAHGTSTLSCVSVSGERSSDRPQPIEVDEVPMMTFHLSSVLKHRDPSGEIEVDMKYAMTIQNFDAIESDEAWLAQLKWLMRGTTDRAVRHMELQLQVGGLNKTTSVWKPPRTPDYASELHNITHAVHPSEMPASDRDCIVCADDLAGPGMEPLALRCNQKHIICKSCLLKVLASKYPDDATCPYCRQTIFIEQKSLDRLKFSITDGAFLADPQYDAWENFIRSCADLDTSLAEHNDEKVHVDEKLMLRIWEHLVEGMLLESEYSTPLDLQPARMPECAILLQAMRTALHSLDGANIPVRSLYRLLLDDIARHFARIMLGSSVVHTLSPDDQDVLVHQPQESLALIGFRPGFVEFFERMLSRMLRFVQLRVCGGCCWGGLNTERGWHGHGLRMHYRPRSAREEEQEQKSSALQKRKPRSRKV
ncbi:hypothetical protein LTR86_008772 [Recurvomyces mirabilis]|nr:hypothetical protein LTR86_008772 [Recurvomyces mirabilis]